MKLLLASTIAVSAAAMASGCATRGDVTKLRNEIGSVAKECVDMRWDALHRNSDTLRLVNVLENKVKAIEAQFGDTWEDPACELYTPEAQKLFCKRIIRAPLTQADFDRLADEAVRKTDAYFCSKAKTEWERRAFCAPSTEKGGERK